MFETSTISEFRSAFRHLNGYSSSAEFVCVYISHKFTMVMTAAAYT
jgi:hypothetical protein